LWQGCPGKTSPRALGLLGAGLAIPEAGALAATAPTATLLRFLVWALRRPGAALALPGARTRYADHYAFLLVAPLTRQVAAR
jgi:hypothetical protein